MAVEDEEPFWIESWERFCRDCIKEGKLKYFSKTLGDFIEVTNAPIKKGIQAHVDSIYGEMMMAKVKKRKAVNGK